MSQSLEDEILRSLRRITRAIDLYSRKLAARFGLTGPQLVCLRALEANGPSTPSELSRQVELSQATMTGILDRLEAAGLVLRARNQADRRRVSVTLTPAGQNLLENAPSALQESLRGQLSALPLEEQRQISVTLQRVVEMMGAEEIPASPVLTSGPMDAGPREVASLLGGAPQPMAGHKEE